MAMTEGSVEDHARTPASTSTSTGPRDVKDAA